MDLHHNPTARAACLMAAALLALCACEDASAPKRDAGGAAPALPIRAAAGPAGTAPSAMMTWDRSWTARQGLPQARWVTSGGITSTIVPLRSAPFPAEGYPYTDSSVLIAFPEGMAPDGPLALATHFHGFSVELRSMVERGQLLEQLRSSGTRTVLVVPQGPMEARSGDFGKLMEPWGFRRLTQDVLAMLARDGFISEVKTDRVIVSAHSGGYQAAARVLQVGGVKVDTVLLFDALYGHSDVFADFVRSGGALRTLFTSGGGTIDGNIALQRRLEADDIPVSDALYDPRSRVVVAYSPHNHSACLHLGRPMAWWFTQIGLPPRAGAPTAQALPQTTPLVELGSFTEP